MKLSLLCVPFLAITIASAQIPAPTDAPTARSPEQSAAAFKLPDGFRMEVIASEPLIASPSGVCWDERGRMFVSELHGYNLEGQLENIRPRSSQHTPEGDAMSGSLAMTSMRKPSGSL